MNTIEKLQEICDRVGVELTYFLFMRCGYDNNNDLINIDEYELRTNSIPFELVLAHEIGHATGRRNRLDRLDRVYKSRKLLEFAYGMMGEVDKEEEAIADLFAIMLLKRIGWSSPAIKKFYGHENRKDYRGPMTQLVRRKVRDALKYIDSLPAYQDAV